MAPRSWTLEHIVKATTNFHVWVVVVSLTCEYYIKFTLKTFPWLEASGQIPEDGNENFEKMILHGQTRNLYGVKMTAGVVVSGKSSWSTMVVSWVAGGIDGGVDSDGLE